MKQDNRKIHIDQMQTKTQNKATYSKYQVS